MASGWDELQRVQAESIQKCAELAKQVKVDLLSVPTERFSSCEDFKTRATVFTMAKSFHFVCIARSTNAYLLRVL